MPISRPAHRSIGLVTRFSISIALLAVVAGCQHTILPTGSIGPVVANADTPRPTGLPSTPIATQRADEALPPLPSIPPENGKLLIRVIYYSDTGSGGDPGTTILEDGRVIWSMSTDRVVEARVASGALRPLRDDIAAMGTLDAEGHYFAKLRPGAQPPGHGVNAYAFEVIRHGQLVIVTSQDPRSFSGEEQLWIIPPEMRALAVLARRLDDPVAGLGSELFDTPVHPYRANRFLVRILLSEQRGDGNYLAGDVRWPFGEPIERAGEAYDLHDDFWKARCLLIDAPMAGQMVEAEAAVGAQRDLTRPFTIVDYDSETGGSITVEMTALLPHESGSCAELARSPR